MKHVLRVVLLSAALLGCASAIAQTPVASQPAMTQAERFAAKVAEYEAEDRAHPPPKGALLFAGDSQFYRWKTIHEDLKGYTLINRGIDSFQLEHLIQYADRLVLPYEPRLIVLHVGGNDVHTGKSPERVLADFKTLVAKIRVKYPKVPIVFSSLTPGPGRWDEAPQRIATNRALRDYIATQPDLRFIDLWTAMLTSDGKPREDLWVADRVHPNHAGYLLRVELTRPFLGAPDQARPD
jgi:lysophospholipase L1-like esterase